MSATRPTTHPNTLHSLVKTSLKFAGRAVTASLAFSSPSLTRVAIGPINFLTASLMNPASGCDKRMRELMNEK